MQPKCMKDRHAYLGFAVLMQVNVLEWNESHGSKQEYLREEW